ncbi:MAG: hypothetical protein AB1427_16700 [Thermodesulfobacteriota bacterium]
MKINEVYELLPWEVLRDWAKRVKFNETIVNANFPKYRDWSKKAVFADFLMDHVDEGFNFANVSYAKADPIRGEDLAGTDLLELYKLYFDSSRAEEEGADSQFRREWNNKLEDIAGRFVKQYANDLPGRN